VGILDSVFFRASQGQVEKWASDPKCIEQDAAINELKSTHRSFSRRPRELRIRSGLFFVLLPVVFGILAAISL
jgi:hypothetical protein